MSGRASFSVPSFPSLGNTRPSMPPLTSPRAITPDSNGVSNTGRAAGANLITRVLANTSQINGLGGRVDLLA